MDAVVLVEGISDQIAVETLARRHARDLAREGIQVVPIGGAQAIGRALERFASMRVVGLCDAGEEEVFRRRQLEFYVCDADLEDELIRAVGIDAVLELLEANGDLHAFRTFQKQPAWRGRRVDSQLRRFMGSADRRKIRYARVFVEALDLDRMPRPLDAVLGYFARGSRSATGGV
jgi:OLD-like protein